MSIRIGINGFGRIGRLVFRALHEQGLVGSDIKIVAVGDIVPADNLAYLLKYDTVMGTFARTVRFDEESLHVDDKRVLMTCERDPSKLLWGELGVDVVVE